MGGVEPRYVYIEKEVLVSTIIPFRWLSILPFFWLKEKSG
jgi:hypothetical protein